MSNTDLFNNMDDFDSMKISKSSVHIFLFIKPSLKFLKQLKKNDDLNLMIDTFLKKVEEVSDDKELLNLSITISNSDIDDKIKIKFLTEITKIMYKLHNIEVIKAELM
jgi:hypothetical protein